MRACLRTCLHASNVNIMCRQTYLYYVNNGLQPKTAKSMFFVPTRLHDLLYLSLNQLLFFLSAREAFN